MFGQYKSRQRSEKIVSYFGRIFGIYGSIFSKSMGLPFLQNEGWGGGGKEGEGRGFVNITKSRMPLAEGGESISGDLKIDLRRLKNHSKQIDFSFSADLYGRLWWWGSGLYSVIYTTNADGARSIGICLLFLGESQPVALFFDNFLAVYDINAFLQSV